MFDKDSSQNQFDDLRIRQLNLDQEQEEDINIHAYGTPIEKVNAFKFGSISSSQQCTTLASKKNYEGIEASKFLFKEEEFKMDID